MSEAERKGVITFKGNPLTLIGPEIKVGDKAPNFTALGGGLKEITLAESKGKTRFISVVPSLDTPVCEVQTKRFNEEAIKFPSDIAVYTISMDLPFAQSRFCSAQHADKIIPLSDHRDASFGRAYGVLIKELRLLARAVFIIGPDDKVQYVQYVKEVTEHPDYEKALNALKTGTKK